MLLSVKNCGETLVLLDSYHQLQANKDNSSIISTDITNINIQDCVEIADYNDVRQKTGLKRKSNEPMKDSKRFNAPRYIGDLRRKDFTSDTSWKIVQKFVKTSKSQSKVLNQKVKRLDKKVKSLKSLLHHLKKNGLLSSEVNNNPTCRQFRSSYNKLVTHVNSIVPDTSNCILQNDTNILRLSDTSTSTEISTDKLPSIVFEHDYMGSNGWSWNEYSHEIVTYIAGSSVKSIKPSIKCELCLDQLENDSTSSKLITLKNRVTKNKETTNSQRKTGLITPSDDVITICKTAEKVLRSTPNLSCMKNVLKKVMMHAKKLLLPLNIFSKLDMFLEKTILHNHKLDLINQILNRYFKIRLHHEAKSSQDLIKRRTFHNRMVLFTNQ
ncbi:uncharacterized protein LOC105184565 isoform X2 [Harpegnathos saltator]|nr:uncharacterized protein LOC105184565 isoform X2 [Harpegnathos saltator]